MKVAIVDIKANTPKYDSSLTSALSKIEGVELTVFIPSSKDFNFMCSVHHLPKFYRGTAVSASNIIKGLNALFNYIVLIMSVYKNKYDIIHIQWLALIQKTSLEYYILKIISKRSKIVYTVHNVYPHGLDTDHNSPYALAYKRRFKQLDDIISQYIVHTESTKKQLINDFNISAEKIEICNHGIFIPEIRTHNVVPRNDDSLRISMFGSQNYYKGTDILVTAVSMIPDAVRKKMQITIAGLSSDYHGTTWQEKAKDLGILWIDKMLEEEEMDSLIRNSDLLVFPYRAISQSGALLLALSYNKAIITSDLPSFKETLYGFTDDMFFKTEDSKSLAELITRCVYGEFDYGLQKKVINTLVEKYSWSNSACQTISAYNRALKQ